MIIRLTGVTSRDQPDLARSHGAQVSHRPLLDACGSLRSDVATALATVHASKGPERNRHAISVFRRRSHPSARARRRPSSPGLPQSAQRFCALARRSTSRGSRHSLARRAAANATLSLRAARVRADPSPRRAPTGVHSQLIKGNPSATTSNLLASPASCNSSSRSRAKMSVATRPPASRQILAATLSTAHPLLPRTPAHAYAAQ